MAESELQRSRREPRAFSAFYRARYDAVVAYFARRVFDPDIALDLTAETFAEAYLARSRFRGSTDAEEAAWLFKIAARKLWRYQRRGELERKALDRLRIEAPVVTVAQRRRVEDLADIEGIRSVLRQELSRLSVEQKAAINLRVIQDLSYADVAERLSITEKAARARVARGLQALADGLEASRTYGG